MTPLDRYYQHKRKSNFRAMPSLLGRGLLNRGMSTRLRSSKLVGIVAEGVEGELRIGEFGPRDSIFGLAFGAAHTCRGTTKRRRVRALTAFGTV